eukprot:GFUD01012199.1.p1 GENE.GFUD01012199.1~~GFUD01012199.1.p1  ORF type:complete len:437 (+),score=119.99 GFUD01012199.1:158-1468(+)
MDAIKQWLDGVPDLKDGYQMDESEAARGKFSICCHVKIKGGNTFILKRSIVGEMEARGGEKWVRDVRSLAAEFDFYKEYSRVKEEDSEASSYSIPKLFGSFTNFEFEKDSPEKLFAKEGSIYKPRDDLVFALLMEDLGSREKNPQYDQNTNGLSMSELSDFLESLATFHGETAAIAKHLDSQSNIWKLGGFWTKDKRQSFDKEVAGISSRWGSFYALWEDVLLASIESDQFGIMSMLSRHSSIEITKVKAKTVELLPNLGEELASHCHQMSEVVEQEPRLCIVQGDNKVANIFHCAAAKDKFKWIDFQWAGLGSPTLDLVYIVAGSVQEVDNLEHRLESLLSTYWEKFDQLVDPNARKGSSEKVCEERFFNFKAGFLDYCRVVLGYMWDGKLSQQVVQSREGKINFCLHNRSVKHVCWITQKIVQYLAELKLVNFM